MIENTQQQDVPKLIEARSCMTCRHKPTPEDWQYSSSTRRTETAPAESATISLYCAKTGLWLVKDVADATIVDEYLGSQVCCKWEGS